MKESEKQKLKREQLEWIKRKDAIADPADRSKFIQARTAELKRRFGK